MNLTTKTVKGVGWAGTSQAARLVLQFGITALLARLLTPQDFGLIAMTVVFTNFVMVFRDLGLTAALVQRKELTEEHLSSSFWLNIVAGLLLSLAMAGAAQGIALFYGEPRLTQITRVLSLTFLISSFGIVQTALLIKKLQFKHLAVIEISAVALSGVVAVFLAFAGFGEWSLVWQQIISSFTRAIFLWISSKWRPRLLFRWQCVKELLRFGLNLTGFNFVNYFNRNLDNLLIGKFLGSTPLGFYNLAYRLLLFPLGNISSVLGRVMFPALSAIQEDKAKVCRAYLRATRYIAAVTFPMMIGMAAVAPQFVRVVFGPQWERSIFLVQILALVSVLQSIGTTVGWIYTSQGRTDIMFRWGTFSVAIYTVAFIGGLRWDVEGVAIAYAIAAFLLSYPNFAIPFRLIDLRVSCLFRQLSPAFLAALGMGGIVLALGLFLKDSLGAGDLTTLISTVAVGIVSYAALLFILDKEVCREIFQLLHQLKPSA